MRVKISYTIDVDEVMDKVREIIGRSCEILEDSVDELSELRHDPRTIISQVDSVRLGLKSADEILSDASGILAGYIEMNEHPQNPEAPIPQPSSDALDRTVEKIDALQRQLLGEAAGEEGDAK